LADDDAYLDCATSILKHVSTYPDWSFVVVTPLSVLFAMVLYHVVEIPVAAYFRG
jgi:peptidoglycan/LPS O-acetylase OafA/YrhL